MPPPNVTGQLHMGHAMDCTSENILIRFKRMQGFAALWLPGTDHAGITTQIKVEEALRNEENLTRYDLAGNSLARRLGLEEHLWRPHCGPAKKMGASCDWERSRFTMDEGYSQGRPGGLCLPLSTKIFIYKGSRIINWCPITALSDAEVEYKEKPGHLWHLKYPIKGEPGRFVVVATSRPETMLGDSGVAVNPEDPRYQDLIGKTCILPLMEREIPIVADDYVDVAFGTGCVKMTPAHDPGRLRGGPAPQSGIHPGAGRQRQGQ